ncbi:MAG: hypothetical protein HRU15_13470 [Planctomycetes bacterium]|nr:hypothetical protein [Planctomycetota bacterium]
MVPFFFEFPVDQASSVAKDIDWVINFVHYIVFAGLFVAEAVLIYFLINYKKRKNDTRKVAYVPADTMRGGVGLVIGVVGFLLVVDLFIEVFTAPVWEDIKVHQKVEGEYDLLVRIKGRQYAWDITYAGKDGYLDTADDIKPTAEEGFMVPLNKMVRFQLESADVLHAFHVAAFRLKQDAVPGRSIPGWFEAIQAGTYELACAELCGRDHSTMRTFMHVVPAEKFDAWLATK